MVSSSSLQRSPEGTLPRTDVQLAKNAWKYVNRKIKEHRQNRDKMSEGDSNLHKTQSQESGASKADTLVPTGDATVKKGQK
ncbi:hypothetical protein N7532_008891 [Penicillium argentinense]|uniref:Uncharacterized protein n=1 Tax=Penicillium argentinense TaxID=1131581 RepID=A0A9W9EY85_9EURO|nr:uncharacterized protein N7532_008891 [Penicillium argentinense]KAJ5090207.1 hypothetical protein N7532_008891 [Penicillium argentinense]